MRAPPSPSSRQKPPAVPARALAPHEIRIIGGQWRRTPLKVLDKPGLRPTPDRVRETLFNWLGQDLSGWRCVDAFAGTGALGLEAASRGAAQVIALEQEPELARQLQRQVDRLQASMVQVQRTDAVAAMQRLSPGAFDLVFLDPPFGAAWLDQLWPRLPALLTSGARVYVESESPLTSPPPGFEIERAARAGQVHYHLLRWVSVSPIRDAISETTKEHSCPEPSTPGPSIP